MHSRRIRFDGADHDEMQFSTPSWSRPKSEIRHTITINKRTGDVRCTCEDAVYRMQHAGFMDENEQQGCKHIRKLLATTNRIRREQLEHVIHA